jgi:hypothetical protein
LMRVDSYPFLPLLQKIGLESLVHQNAFPKMLISRPI